MHFRTLLLSTFLSSVHIFSSHHVIFEEICKMAGTLSYIHSIVLVNISRLIRAIGRFQQDVPHLKTGYQKRQLRHEGKTG